eukprot:TRINITY_DN5638_c0_g1_i2.p2 TRINITY_DN5638_c0_g1~~TRINITY_DN5638_c0_g1_i2.p2  ORF type:complete len:103 (+),score=9.54 TRINITY_DN5638_c0_g1_i2:237-545(+)
MCIRDRNHLNTSIALLNTPYCTIHLQQLSDWPCTVDYCQTSSQPSCIQCRISYTCLLYTSDAADEEDSVDLGGRRILKKTKKHQIQEQPESENNKNENIGTQ